MLACLNIASAQNYTNSISGVITGKEDLTNIKLVVKTFGSDQLIENWKPVSVDSVKVNEKGDFSCQYNAPGKDFYLQIELFKNGNLLPDLFGKITFTRLYSQLGDSLVLEMDFDRKVGRFTGTGAEKMNVQFLLNLTQKPSSASEITNHFLNHEPQVAARYRIEHAALVMKTAILDSYKGLLPQPVYQRIRTDMTLKSKFEALRGLIDIAIRQNMLDENASFIDQTMYDSNSFGFMDTNETISPYRCEYIFQRWHILYDNAKKKSQTSLSFTDWTLDRLRDFGGRKLRDDLLIALVFKWMRYHSEEFKDRMPIVYAMIGNNQKKTMLKKIVQIIDPKEKIIPFEFIDEEGNKLTSESLKGKMVLMDFWFTGCRACTQIPPILRSIMERLKHREDIVYLSINVSETKEIWQMGLNDGKYTVPGQVHVFAGGGRYSHPFLKKYHIMGYPHISLIGKNHEILDFNLEPRRDNGERIVKLIQEYKF